MASADTASTEYRRLPGVFPDGAGDSYELLWGRHFWKPAGQVLSPHLSAASQGAFSATSAPSPVNSQTSIPAPPDLQTMAGHQDSASASALLRKLPAPSKASQVPLHPSSL